MKIVMPSVLRAKLRELCDDAVAGEPIVVYRPRAENVVIISEKTYNELTKKNEETRKGD